MLTLKTGGTTKQQRHKGKPETLAAKKRKKHKRENGFLTTNHTKYTKDGNLSLGQFFRELRE